MSMMRQVLTSDPYTTRDVPLYFLIFYFHHTATTDIYTLSLHDALPISGSSISGAATLDERLYDMASCWWEILGHVVQPLIRSEEHTSELQSLTNLVCRLLLEKKKPNTRAAYTRTQAERHSSRAGCPH